MASLLLLKLATISIPETLTQKSGCGNGRKWQAKKGSRLCPVDGHLNQNPGTQLECGAETSISEVATTCSISENIKKIVNVTYLQSVN